MNGRSLLFTLLILFTSVLGWAIASAQGAVHDSEAYEPAISPSADAQHVQLVGQLPGVGVTVLAAGGNYVYARFETLGGCRCIRSGGTH